MHDTTGWAEQGEKMILELTELIQRHNPHSHLTVGVLGSIFLGALRALVKFGDATWARRQALEWSRELRKFSEES